MDKININEIFKPLFSTDKRYILITGGRGSGKSFVATLFDCLKTFERGHKTLFTRYTLQSAEISIIPEYTNKIELINQRHNFEITKKEIYNKITGSSIIFRGIKTSSGNQTANLKSIQNITTWILDEAEELIDEDIFDRIDESIRTTTKQNRIILILNPTSIKHWIYKKWFLNSFEWVDINGFKIQKSINNDICHIHSTYLNNIENLSSSFIEKADKLRLQNPNKYAHRFLGKWIESVEGTVFDYEDLQFYNEPELNADSEFTIAYVDVADQGADYLCCLFAKVFEKKLYIIDVVYSKFQSEITKPIIISKIQKYNVNTIVFESNNMGAMYGKDVRNILKEMNIKTLVRLLGNYTNKQTRILMFAEHIKEYFVFKDEKNYKTEYYQYLQDLCNYMKEGKNEHDDAPDATAGLAMFYFNSFARQKGIKYNLKTI